MLLALDSKPDFHTDSGGATPLDISAGEGVRVRLVNHCFDGVALSLCHYYHCGLIGSDLRPPTTLVLSSPSDLSAPTVYAYVRHDGSIHFHFTSRAFSFIILSHARLFPPPSCYIGAL